MTGTQPQDRRLGYTRVGTYGQTLDAQLEQLCGAGCTKIYREKVTVTRIDRLARSTFDLFGIGKRIVAPRRNSDPWQSRGPTPAPTLGA
jgi:hypothetical protein